jgi:hypothetical protein
MTGTKRRLPVLASSGEPQEAPRPAGSWVGFGALMVLTVWLPLAYAGVLIARRFAPRLGPTGAVVVPVVVAGVAPLLAGAVAGGFLVGRFGKPAGVKHAALAGAVAGGLAVLFTTATSAHFEPWSLLVIVLAAAGGAGGGAWGVRGRPL